MTATATERKVYDIHAGRTEDENAAEMRRAQIDQSAGVIDMDTLVDVMSHWAKVVQAQATAKAAENALGNFTIKVSESGCVQMRGVPGANVQFGLTLSPRTLEFLYRKPNADKIQAFIVENKDKLRWAAKPKA